MAAAIDAELCKPRNCGRRKNYPNVVTSTIEEWYKINVAIPFLDHSITDLQVCFSAHGKKCSFVTLFGSFCNIKRWVSGFLNLPQ